MPRDLLAEQQDAGPRDLLASPTAGTANINDVEELTAGGIAKDMAVQFLENFNAGLYGTLNLPNALINAGLSLTPTDFRLGRPLQGVAPSIDESLVSVPEAKSAAGEISGVVGEFSGANAIPGAGLIAAAPRIVANTAKATGLLGQSVNRMAAGIANTPGAAAIGEGLSTVGAGVGASVARENFPDNNLAEVLLSTAGGFGLPLVGAIAPTSLAIRGANKVRNTIQPDEVAKSNRQILGREIQEKLTPEAKVELRKTKKLQRQIPGFKATVAQATEDPSFIATQRAFERSANPEEMTQALQARAANEAAVARARQNQAPQSNMTPEDAFAEAAVRVRRGEETINQAANRLEQAGGEIADSLNPGQRRRVSGAQLREELIEEAAEVKASMRMTAEGMGLDDPGVVVDFKSMKAGLSEVVEPRSKLSDPRARPNEIMKSIDDMDDTASIVDLMELRSRIGKDIREAKSNPSLNKREAPLQALKSELDTQVDTALRRTEDPEIADRLKKFRAMYREDYIVPFEQGAAGQVLSKDLKGAYKVPDEKVAEKFFKGWNQTASDQFNKIFPDSPAANAAMESAAMDDLFNSSVVDGVIDSNKMQSWVRRNNGVLEDFPRIQRRVANATEATAALAERGAVLNSRLKQVQNTALARDLNKITAGTTNPEQLIELSIDRNPTRMKRLMNSVKSPDAKAAIQRHVWDRVLSEGNPFEYMQDNKASLKMALGPRFKTAQNIAKAINKNKLVPDPRAAPLDTNPVAQVEELLGTSMSAIGSRVFAVKSGRTGPLWSTFDIMSRTFSAATKRQSREILRGALYDPKVAQALVDGITGKELTPASAKRLYTFMLSSGILATGRDDADQGP